MTVIVRKNGRGEAVFREVAKLVNLDSVIGVRADGLLVRRDEKHFDGVTGIFFSKKGNIIEKLLFLRGSDASKIVPYKRGALEICIS